MGPLRAAAVRLLQMDTEEENDGSAARCCVFTALRADKRAASPVGALMIPGPECSVHGALGRGCTSPKTRVCRRFQLETRRSRITLRF